MHFRLCNAFGFTCRIRLSGLQQKHSRKHDLPKRAYNLYGNRSVFICQVFGQNGQVQLNQEQFHRQCDNIPERLQLWNVFFPRDCDQVPFIPQSPHPFDVSGDVCAYDIPVMAVAVHPKQNPICENNQWSLNAPQSYFFNLFF